MFVLLIVVETRVPEPLLALRLYGERMFRTANVVMSFTFGSFAGVIFLMPLYLQTLRGFTPLQSGLTTFPQALGAIVSSKWSVGSISAWDHAASSCSACSPCQRSRFRSRS